MARPRPCLLDQRVELCGGIIEWGRCRRLRDEASMTSTMLRVKVDRSDDADLHDQVASSIRRAIAGGEADVGERLPPAGDLAAVIGVNKNTVLRALRMLRDEGLLEFRRGRGVTVVAAPPQGEVMEGAIELVRLAERNGYRRDELVALIQGI